MITYKIKVYGADFNTPKIIEVPEEFVIVSDKELTSDELDEEVKIRLESDTDYDINDWFELICEWVDFDYEIINKEN